MISDDNIHWIVDGLKDYGRFGEMLVPHKDGLDFSRAEIFPEEVSSLNFRWGIPPDFKTKPGGDVGANIGGGVYGTLTGALWLHVR